MEHVLEKRFPLNAEDYTLYEEVGEGVSASVYRALCVPLNEIVAIKVLDLEKCNNDLVCRLYIVSIFYSTSPFHLNGACLDSMTCEIIKKGQFQSLLFITLFGANLCICVFSVVHFFSLLNKYVGSIICFNTRIISMIQSLIHCLFILVTVFRSCHIGYILIDSSANYAGWHSKRGADHELD